MTTNALRRSLYGMVVLYFTACAAAWPLVPERLPLHFGLTGRVTSWTRASPAVWLLLPVVAAGVIALVRATTGPPEGWNLSRDDQKRFRRLTADTQAQIREAAERSTLAMLILFLVALGWLQVGIFATAVTQAGRMPGYAAAAMLLSLAGAMVVGTRGQRRVRARIRAAAGSDGGQTAEGSPPRTG